MKFIKEVEYLIYGSGIIEAWNLDSLLQTMSDGLPRPQTAFLNTGAVSPFKTERIVNKLLEDNVIIARGDNYIITAKGMLHLAKGGYTADIKQSKRLVITFWMSILAFLMSFSAFLTTILNGSMPNAFKHVFFKH